MRRVSVTIRGTIQGVGFRPWACRLARERALLGWVRNERDAVHLEAQGEDDDVAGFLAALSAPPPPALVRELRVHELHAVPDEAFHIASSTRGEAPSSARATIPPDIAPCSECLAELVRPDNRRYRYPFTSCARCGPRYSIVEALPWDRERTSMRAFPLCADCAREHDDPADRRFHAQPIACPACGPTLELLSLEGGAAARTDDALARAIALLEEGKVLALKGVGGFQLLVDASRDDAVRELRWRKQRRDRPLAVMVATVDAARTLCKVSDAAARALAGPAAPVVLLPMLPDTGRGVAPSVAPHLDHLGVMLPSSPLHAMLAHAFGGALVCTSGNISGEPLCTRTREARRRLGGIACALLTHDRTVVRPLDDSVLAVGAFGPQVLRRGRGLAPRPLPLPEPGNVPALGLGAHLKAAVALAHAGEVVLGPHVGDLDCARARAAHKTSAIDLVKLLGATPGIIACDLHPDYASTRLAERLAADWGAQIVQVQHHHAHIAACMTEHGLTDRTFGLAWDGSGFGTDGTVWGGEALLVDREGWRRTAHLRQFPLPGGDVAAREPRRAALGLLAAMGERGQAQRRAHAWFEGDGAARVLDAAVHRGINAPWTSSVGRLFDAVGALLGVRTVSSYEGQTAMELEALARRGGTDALLWPFPITLTQDSPAVLDWEPMVRALVEGIDLGVDPAGLAARFHATLALAAEQMAARAGLDDVVLTGGCFQNRLLEAMTALRLRAAGFRVRTHREVPPGDGGLAVGQVAVALWGRSTGGGAHLETWGGS
jgi:hydrogenase maturation protein HypF